ncbi:hypothetical protein AJ80_03627 [Polytolypa hystricis UAMH7299]|uniref:Aminoglycoside phosphotransferase domain-containing protein n=1 Tax=Polytolypa hystricis (strain UAMH7299) TaxID=1447883 RepID=A0A2B7YH12_POLH7|nr:hypothetical protein AJ80_03627 [Polytolypa hystricis UAMH7299]
MRGVGTDNITPEPDEVLGDKIVWHRLYTRATLFFEQVEWGELAAIVSRHRDGISCSYHEKFSLGHFNMVRQIEFEDGVKWVARLRMPKIGGGFDREALHDESAMKCYAYWLNNRKHTSIPVPEVFCHDLSPDNKVGAPYILMEYIHGTAALDLKGVKGSTMSFGTPEQDQRFKQQMANIQLELSTFKTGVGDG